MVVGQRFGALLLMLLPLVTPAQAAEFSMRDFTRKVAGTPIRLAVISMTGPIEASDDAFFSYLVEKNYADGVLVIGLNIQSPGGDIAAALKIGDLVRRLGMSVTTPNLMEISEEDRVSFCVNFDDGAWAIDRQHGNRNCVCLSACAIIWSAGLRRVGDAVGFHRPYFQNYGDMSFKEADTAQKLVSKAVKEALLGWGIPEAIVDTGMSRASNDIYWLSQREADLIGDSDTWEEYRISECGQYIATKIETDEFIRLMMKRDEGTSDFTLSEKNFLDDYNERGEVERTCTLSLHIRIVQELYGSAYSKQE